MEAAKKRKTSWMVQLAFLFVLIRFLFYPIIQRPGRVRDRVGQGAAAWKKRS